MEQETHRLGFFSGMLLGMAVPLLVPLLIFGGEIHYSKNAVCTEAFNGGVVAGVLLDIALIVGLIFLFRN